jgi:hypothetical protein
MIFKKVITSDIVLDNLGGAWQSDYCRLVYHEREYLTLFGVKLFKINEIKVYDSDDYYYYKEMNLDNTFLKKIEMFKIRLKREDLLNKIL